MITQMERVRDWPLMNRTGIDAGVVSSSLMERRRKVLDLIEAGRMVADVARDLGVSAQSIYL